MPSWKNLLNPPSYVRQLERICLGFLTWLRPNYLGATSPGDYGSPLLDLANIESLKRYDGAALWEFVDLRPAAQRAYFEDLLSSHTVFDFPPQPSDGYRYYTDNSWFGAADAFTLAGVMQKERPRRIIEVGSGFSSAVMLDVTQRLALPTRLTFIEPHPGRLLALVDPDTRPGVTLRRETVQEVPLEVFERLEAGDVLFIDSSHIAKIGSDVAWLCLRILPRLKPGVLIHVHDIFYPHSYPDDWIERGYAWNESLFLRALLLGHAGFEIVAFNAYAAQAFPELFRTRLPAFLTTRGQSLWLRRPPAAGAG